MPYKKSTQKKYGDNPLQKKSAFTLKSGSNIVGRNGRDVNFKQMGSDSPVKQTNFIGSFSNFLKSKQTREGSDIGELKRRMRHPNIEVSTKAQRENRERLKKLREKDEPTVEIPKGKGEEIIIPGAGEQPHYQTGGGFEGKDFKPHEFTREGGDPYSYRTKEGGGYEFKSLEGKGGRKKGEWYEAKGGVAEIEAAWKESMGIKE